MIVYTDHIFDAWPTSLLSQRAADGYTQGNISEDGTLVIGSKGNTEINPAVPTNTPRPNYFPGGFALGFPNNISHQEAEQIVRLQASAIDATDGWTYVPSVAEQLALFGIV